MGVSRPFPPLSFTVLKKRRGRPGIFGHAVKSGRQCTCKHMGWGDPGGGGGGGGGSLAGQTFAARGGEGGAREGGKRTSGHYRQVSVAWPYGIWIWRN